MEPEKNKLDQWLDQALNEYGQVELRLGLETRILATLAAEKTSITRRTLWPWAFISMAVALTMVVAILAWLNTQKSHTLSISSANNNIAIQQKETMVSAKPDVKSRTPTTVKPEIQRQVTKATEFAKEPRLNQFPSPAPLNEQEELLARYVESRHPEAVMVARVRAEIEKQNLERMEQTDSE